jgi:hypothetical protein
MIVYLLQLLQSSKKTFVMYTPNKKAVVGILSAAAIGTGLYFLLSSEKGSHWRQKLSDSAQDIACRIGDYFSGAKDKLTSA